MTPCVDQNIFVTFLWSTPVAGVVWLSKKKPLPGRREPPAPIVYERGEDPNARKTIEADSGAYKDALALFGGGSEEVKAAINHLVGYDGVSLTIKPPRNRSLVHGFTIPMATVQARTS